MNNEKVSIQELVDSIAQQADTSKKKVEDFLKVFQATIEDGLIKEGLVKVKGFGTFKLIWNEARKSVNVQTGEECLILGHNKVSFLPDATIKELINKPYRHLTNASLDGDVPVKHEINPLDKLNEQAEEIKVIIAEIKDLNEPEVEAPRQVEIKEEKVEETVAETPEEIVEERVAETPKEIITEVKAEVKEEVKTQAVTHNYPHESIQHAAL